MNALIGYTGFVGGNINRQHKFDYKYNSSNISEVRGKIFNLIVCAAAPGVKWKANKFPEEDFKSINNLISNLKEAQTKHFVLISTVDVYKNPVDVDEDTKINVDELQPYGKNRFLLENFVREKFDDALILRLPGLFGPGLKKNFIYDLLNNNCLDLTDCDSEFQFYNLNNLWKDINVALKNNIKLVDICAEPVKCKDVALNSFGIKFKNKTKNSPVKYNMKSKYSEIYGGKNGYMYSKDDTYIQIKQFVDYIRKGGK